MSAELKAYLTKLPKVWITVVVMKTTYDLFNKPNAPFWEGVFLSAIQTLLLAGMALGLHKMLSEPQNEANKES